MSYITGQRVQLLPIKQHGTVTRDADDHAIVRVLWDNEDIPRWELPECIAPEGKQQVASVRDAWARSEKARAR